jgi:hypothetical protein
MNFRKLILNDLEKSAFHSSIMTHHRFCSMNNTEDDINGAGTDYPAEVLLQYSTDSLITIPSQSVT